MYKDVMKCGLTKHLCIKRNTSDLISEEVLNGERREGAERSIKINITDGG